MEFQEANRNYEEFLAAIGTGPCSQDMVMRAAVTLTIEQVAMVLEAGNHPGQEMDKQWRISSETVIKAKSVRGYRTANRKWTENKFKVSGGRDTRYRCRRPGRVSRSWWTTGTSGWWSPPSPPPRTAGSSSTKWRRRTRWGRLAGSRLTFTLQMHCKDTTIEMDVYPEEPEILIMTCKVDIPYLTWPNFRTNCLEVFSTLFS